MTLKSHIVLSLLLATFTLTFSQSVQADMVTDWNVTATTAAAAPIKNGVVQTRIYAMVHAAVHDALNAIDRRYHPYALDVLVDPDASPEAAVAAAAHDVLVHELRSRSTPSSMRSTRARLRASRTAPLRWRLSLLGTPQPQ